MKIKNVKLDGKQYGVIVYLYELKDYLRSADKTLKLFKSVELAKVYIASNNIRNPHKYRLMFSLNDRIIDFMIAQKINNGYELYINDMKYVLEEGGSDKVIEIGYLNFEESDKKFINQTYRTVKELASKVARTYDINTPTLSSVAKDKNKHLCCNVKDSTAKIHICYNSQIMDLNQKRKEKETRCIPYEKSMDKYGSLFFYVTKDVSEPPEIEGLVKSRYIISQIIESLNNEYGIITSKKNISFKGTIIVD